jgi:hypothetical protein
MSKPSKQAIEALAKEMLESENVPGLRVRRWETASNGTRAAYRNYAQLVLEHPKNR